MGPPPYKNKKNGKDGRDLKGPESSVAGPFCGRDRPFQYFKGHGWGHMARECPSPENYQWGEVKTQEPPPPMNRWMEQQGNSERTMTTQPQYQIQTQNPIDTWAANVGNKSKYYNPDPLVRLIGRANESSVIINGEEQTAIIDSGAQVTTITADLVQKLKLPVYRLHTLINFRGTGGGKIPYYGYMEV